MISTSLDSPLSLAIFCCALNEGTLIAEFHPTAAVRGRGAPKTHTHSVGKGRSEGREREQEQEQRARPRRAGGSVVGTLEAERVQHAERRPLHNSISNSFFFFLIFYFFLR